MPYLRLYSAEVPIEQKRVIAHKLIEITMHPFCLRPEEGYQISIEFISEPKSSAASWIGRSSLRDADCIFEVLGHDLTEEKKRVFCGRNGCGAHPIAAFEIEDANSPSAWGQAGRIAADCFSVWRTQPANQRTLRCTFQLAGCISSSRVSHKRRARSDGR